MVFANALAQLTNLRVIQLFYHLLERVVAFVSLLNKCFGVNFFRKNDRTVAIIFAHLTYFALKLWKITN